MPTRRLRWATLVFDLDPAEGHEQAGERRALVVSYEPYHRSAMVTVCPITAARSEPIYPNEVAIRRGEAGQTMDGVILCHQVRTVSLARARGTVLGYVADSGIRSAVRAAVAVQLGLDIDGFADGADAPARFQ